jgi:dihydrofolate reductase
MLIAHIVAASQNNVIGKDNALPWNLPEDMKWFRERTKGRALIMGRKTFESVGHPLPHRLNVVVTRQKDFAKTLKPFPDHSPVVVCSSLEEALKYCQENASSYKNEIFIIGGGEIYRQSIEHVNTIYLTRVHIELDGDAQYPEIPESQFELVSERHVSGEPAYTFLEYRRKAH